MEKELEQKDLFHEAEGFSILEAINEAKRCLRCKVPQCAKGCPISHDIPDWIHEISKGNFGNAMKIINDNMGENGWELLKNNFDNLHNGFFRNLKERHPELTTNDLRLCSYIRLNLSTKDISRLSGISEKSVEMARYRLRKKMGLDNTSLTEYIMKI